MKLRKTTLRIPGLCAVEKGYGRAFTNIPGAERFNIVNRHAFADTILETGVSMHGSGEKVERDIPRKNGRVGTDEMCRGRKMSEFNNRGAEQYAEPA